MAKPVIKFTAVPYEIGGYKGHRPQLEAKDGVYDLDFCTEVVNEKRLAMSPDELLHAMEMAAEVGPDKVAKDGRPRGCTKLLKWQAYGTGTLESPSSPWNSATCKAVIKPQLMGEATRQIDATFVNTTEGIGVKLANVTWVGAKEVVNVIKIGELIGANGNHMEFDTEIGDTAELIVGKTSYPLTCTESDVTRATFEFPMNLEDVEAGTEAMFVMKSRGGDANGQVYTSKKKVTILDSGKPPVLRLKSLVSTATGLENRWKMFGDDTIIKVVNEGEDFTATWVLTENNGTVTEMPFDSDNYLEKLGPGEYKLHTQHNNTRMPDGSWLSGKIECVMSSGGVTIKREVTLE